MIFLLLLRHVWTISQITIFHGNWTLPLRVKNETDTIAVNYQSSFKFGYQLSKKSFNFSSRHPFYIASATFRNKTKVRFPLDRFSFIGFGFPNQTFFFFSVIRSKDISSQNLAKIVSNEIEQNNNITENISIDLFHKTLINNFESLSSLVTVGFKIQNTTEKSTFFTLPYEMVGEIIFQNVTISLKGTMFHYKEFILESKIYGVISAVIISFTFYSWMSLAFIKSSQKLRQLSTGTYLMHMSFEFNYGNLLLNYCLTYSDLTTLYCLLFLIYSAIFFTVQSIQVFRIWRCSIGSLHTAIDTMRIEAFVFFMEVVLLMLVYLIAVYFMFQSPLWSLILVIGASFPQIAKSAYYDSFEKTDNSFTILSTISRIIIFAYHYAYPKSINGNFSPIVFLSATLAQLFFAAIILMQNKFGGSFFIPKFLKPRGYDYHGHSVAPNTECPICMALIEDSDEVMTTPCKHSFHKECLERWMQEEMICPVCRTSLPDTDYSRNRRSRLYR